MLMTDYIRPRGVKVYPMPTETSPYEPMALVLHPTDPYQARMVHTEGVAYLVNTAKPWTWNDYDPHAKFWSIGELLDLIPTIEPVDLADWIRTHNYRLDQNFTQVHFWATNTEEN